MSTHEREVGAAGIASLANTFTGVDLDAAKSMVHYIWNAFDSIRLVGPEGLWIRLGKGRSYYGQGRPGQGSAPYGYDVHTGRTHPLSPDNKPGETQAEYDARGGDRLMRCQAYPLWNIQYSETLTNLGKFTPQEQASGNALGAQAGHEEVTIHAGVCAADMVSLYGETYGLRSLTPLTGMEDIPTAEELIKLVQPYAFKLTNLAQEEQGRLEDERTLLFDLADDGPAHWRIQGAGLDAVLQQKAMDLRRVMLAGVRRACVTARTEWAELKKQLANAALGKIGFKAMPSAFDEHLAYLIGEAVPSAVARPTQAGTDPDLKNAVQLLTQFVTGGGQIPKADNADEAAEMRSLLAQMRGERTRLEKLRKELADAGQLPQE